MYIDDIKKILEKKRDKKDYLKALLKEETDIDRKRDLRELLIEVIKEQGLVKLSNGEPVQLQLLYDSLSEGLEPIYFWTLDFMRGSGPNGIGLEVNKVEEQFEASVSSGYFGDIGGKISIMQDRAMKILQTVNTVVRSIINLIYDLKEFDIRLETYDDLKSEDIDKREGAGLALKALWMDQVDIKKGRGGVNMMSQQLQFATLRDAFMFAKSEKDAERIDVNKRVKGVLKRKLNEYLKWKEYSERELRKRRSIEKTYLKSQVDSLRLYTKWARPYLLAAQKLQMAEFKTKAGLPTPNIVATFNTMQMELSLFGKKEIKPENVYESYKKIKFPQKYYSCVSVDFKFVAIPQAVRTQQGTQYVHGGQTTINFNAYALTEEEIKELELQELHKDMEIVDNLTEVSLKELQKDIDYYLKEDIDKKLGEIEDKKEKIEYLEEQLRKIEDEDVKAETKLMLKKLKKEFKLKLPFSDAFSGFTDMTKQIVDGIRDLFRFNLESYEARQIKKIAEESALNDCSLIYEIYKKAHGMITW